MKLFLTSQHQAPTAHHAFEPRTTWETPTHYQVQLPTGGTTLAASGSLLLCVTLRTFPRRVHLSNTGLLITTNFSVPVDQHRLSQQSKGFTSVIRITADSLAEADQNYRFFFGWLIDCCLVCWFF